MFNETAYKKLRSTKQFRGFARNCYIGFFATYLAVALFITLLFFLLRNSAVLKCDMSDVMNYLVPCSCVIGVAVLVITYISINKSKPQLCEYGIIVSKDDTHAMVNVNGEIIRGSSFERFLKNVKLDDYKTGDKVLIFSGKKKNGRPLFIHAD